MKLTQEQWFSAVGVTADLTEALRLRDFAQSNNKEPTNEVAVISNLKSKYGNIVEKPTAHGCRPVTPEEEAAVFEG